MSHTVPLVFLSFLSEFNIFIDPFYFVQVGIVVGLCGIVHWTDIERSDDS